MYADTVNPGRRRTVKKKKYLIPFLKKIFDCTSLNPLGEATLRNIQNIRFVGKHEKFRAAEIKRYQILNFC